MSLRGATERNILYNRYHVTEIPRSRGSNENASGLIRQYLPKATDLSPFTQDELNLIAEGLNDRPQKVLDFMKPNEVFQQMIKTTNPHSNNAALQN